MEVDWPVEDFISSIMTPNFDTFRTELDLSIILPSSISGEPRSRHTNFESYFLGVKNTKSKINSEPFTHKTAQLKLITYH